MSENYPEAKIIFLPFYLQCPQHRNAASARFRAEWPAKYLGADLADEKTSEIDLLKYNIVIFQKCFNQKFVEMAKRVKKYSRARVGLDLCDPEWLIRESEIREMAEAVDFFIVPTEPMKKWFEENYPDKSAITIWDGHDLEYYGWPNEPKNEVGPMKYVWFGNGGTIESLKAIMWLLTSVGGNKDTLTIIADQRAQGAIFDKNIEIIFKEWELETVNEQIKECTLALNPRLNTPPYDFKSNNKTVTAYLLGLPCIERKVNDEEGWRHDLIRFRLSENRIADWKEKINYILENHSMDQLVRVWQYELDKEFKKC
ncbi:MAG: hypothetical protein WC737_05630 [Parcubacteria group bacterium]|jgi:hypothetical protein